MQDLRLFTDITLEKVTSIGRSSINTLMLCKMNKQEVALIKSNTSGLYYLLEDLRIVYKLLYYHYLGTEIALKKLEELEQKVIKSASIIILPETITFNGVYSSFKSNLVI